MPEAVAVCLTFGRRTLGELISMWALQSVRCPLVLWVDGVPELVPVVDLPTFVHLYHAPRLGDDVSIGAVRRAAMQFAIDAFELESEDVLLVLDDDDYYSPIHVQTTLLALWASGAGWTSARCYGVRAPGDEPRLMCPLDPGLGLHATWGITVGRYLAAGGYRPVLIEDVDLYERLGSPTTYHRRVTHVRRTHPAQLSRTPTCYQRSAMRHDADIELALAPSAPDELAELMQWCYLADRRTPSM